MKTIEFEAPDLAEMIQNSLAKNFSLEVLQGIIDKCCAEVVEEAIKDQFKWSGKIKKQLEAHVKDTMGIDTEHLPVPEYTHLVAQGFKNALRGMEDDKIRKEAEELMESILQSAPKEIKLSEIVKMYIDEISDKYCYELKDLDKEVDECDGRVFKTFHFGYTLEDQFPDTSYLSYCKVLTLESDDISESDHRLLLLLRIDGNGEAELTSARRDQKYSEDVSKMDMKDWSKASKLIQSLYKMVSTGTKIIMDENNVDDYFEIDLEPEYN